MSKAFDTEVDTWLKERGLSEGKMKKIKASIMQDENPVEKFNLIKRNVEILKRAYQKRGIKIIGEPKPIGEIEAEEVILGAIERARERIEARKQKARLKRAEKLRTEKEQKEKKEEPSTEKGETIPLIKIPTIKEGEGEEGETITIRHTFVPIKPKKKEKEESHEKA